MALSPNTRLGRYEIRSKIGAGGMGEVYLAQDIKLNRAVALKLLPVEFSADRDRLRRFEQEAFAASTLNHPNILIIYEIGDEDGIHFLATEYIEGETLRRRMAHSAFDLLNTLDIAIQIASALAAAHRAKIVHRDIKPENIMVRRDDALVKVLDFGLAKGSKKHEGGAVDTEASTEALVNTVPGTVMGTVAYMSPEQARGLEVDERTDIWSLGVVIYEMVTGKVPFAGASSNEMIAAIISKERAQPLARFAQAVPERLEEIVAKALAKDREERYQSVKDLLIDLRNLKKKIELDAEIERSVTPELQTSNALAQDSHQSSSVASTRPTAMRTVRDSATHSTPGAENSVSKINRQQYVVIVALAAIILSVTGLILYFHSARHASNKTAIESIAVLPFTNASSDPNLEYLSDGISESLINSLTELQQLRVIARTTAFRYKGKEIDPQALGRELNVRAVLTGHMRLVGDALDIQVDLVDAQTGAQLWGEAYDRKVSDVLSVKQEIAREITGKLRLRLSGEEQRQLVRHDTTNAEAYQFYLRGRYYWNKRTPDNFRKAIGYFQEAIERDPTYALAYSGLSDAYGLLAPYGANPANETMPQAKAAARKALEIDQNLTEAHASLGQILDKYDWDYAGAQRELRRAIELNPNYASAHQWLGESLSALGRHDEGIAELRRASELDPLSLIVNRILGDTYYYARRYDEAIDQYRKTIEIDPNFPTAHVVLAFAYKAKGEYAEAVAEYAKAIELGIRGGDKQEATVVVEAYAKGGWRGFLQSRLTLLKEQSKQRYVPPYSIAIFDAELGEKDEAFAWLEKAYQERDYQMTLIKVDPRLDNLRSDPRFVDLVRRMGLEP